jgi:hypothetical protein
MEGRRRLSTQPGPDRARHVSAFRHGHWRHARQRLARLVAEVGQVADDKDFGMAGHCKIRPDHQAAGTVERRAGALRDDFPQFRSLHARRPQDGLGRYALDRASGANADARAV